MKKIVLRLIKMTIPQKFNFGRIVIKCMTGNDNFPAPKPTLATLDNICNELETAFNEAELARQTAKEKTTIQNQKEAEFNDIMNQMANYVENASDNDEAKILSAGMTPKAKGVRSKDRLPIPENLSASTSDFLGEIELHWDNVKGAKSYNIEISTDFTDDSKWKYAKTSTKSNASISNLTPGQRYWFRVCAVNTNGESGWSEPVMKSVPLD
jgi:hypothetical protein